MLSLKRQKGIVHLGIFGILFLVAALAVGAKVASDPNLIFNINEKAASIGIKTKIEGTLVKEGESGFGPCRDILKNKKIKYGIIQDYEVGIVSSNGTGKDDLPNSPIKPDKCVPIKITFPEISIYPSPTDSLVGKKVVATGTFRNKLFYAISLKKSGGSGEEVCGGIAGKMCPKGYECLYEVYGGPSEPAGRPVTTGGPVVTSSGDKHAPYPDAQGVCKKVATKGCVIGGCNGELCIEESSGGGFSTCAYKAEYACYKAPYAKCEKQKTGKCGWTQNPELKSCLSGNLPD